MSDRFPQRTSAVQIVLLASLTTVNTTMTLAWLAIRDNAVEAAPLAWSLLALMWTVHASSGIGWLRSLRQSGRVFAGSATAATTASHQERGDMSSWTDR